MYVYISHSNYRLPNSSSSRLYIGQDMVALPEEKKQECSPRFAAGHPDWQATMASHTRLPAVHVYLLQYINLEKLPVESKNNNIEFYE